MSTAFVTDNRSEQRRAIDNAILEATAELRTIIPKPQMRDDAQKLAATIRQLTEARQQL